MSGIRCKLTVILRSEANEVPVVIMDMDMDMDMEVEVDEEEEDQECCSSRMVSCSRSRSRSLVGCGSIEMEEILMRRVRRVERLVGRDERKVKVRTW